MSKIDTVESAVIPRQEDIDYIKYLSVMELMSAYEQYEETNCDKYPEDFWAFAHTYTESLITNPMEKEDE